VTLATVAWVPGDCVRNCTPQGLVFTVEVAVAGAEACSYSLSPTSVASPGSGSTHSVEVSTRTGCAWAAESVVTWLMISSAATGSGPGSVTFAVLPNASDARAGNLRIAGQTVIVNQSAPAPAETVPARVANPTPRNGEVGISLLPALTWTGGGGATSYDVYFGTTLPSTPIATTTVPRYVPPPLSPGASYQWRVDARNGAGATTGDVWAFTTAVVATPPERTASPLPANLATGIAVTPTLTWAGGDGATSYDVYIGTTLPATPTATTTTRTYRPSTFNASTSYQWRVDARNNTGTTRGDVWTFTTAAPVAPQLSVEPPAGTRVTPFRFTGTSLTPNGAVTLRVRDPQGGTADQPLVASASGTVGQVGDPAQPVSFGILGINEAWILDLASGMSSNHVSFTVTSRCDVNADYAINTIDVDLVTQAVLMGSTDGRYDLNRDGQVNVADVQTAVNATLNAQSCPL
jgi:hypothetical protein